MANISGVFVPAYIVQESFVSPSIEFEVNNLQDYIGIAPPRAVAGVQTKNAVHIASLEKTGAMMRGFGDLWFNKIHLIPSRIDVGNLTGNQTREIEIFNSFYDQDVIVDDLETTGNLSGVDLDIAPPVTFAPLESKIFLLSVNVAGSPEFDGSYLMQTSIGQLLTLQVLGRRIIVFPFRVDWTSGVKEEINYLSKVYEASAGSEQRVLHNRGKSRRSIEYDHIFAASNDLDESNNLRMLFDSLVYGWQNRNFIIGESFDDRLLENDIAAGAMFVPTITAYRDFEIGSYLLLWRNEYDFEAGEVADILPNGISLARPLEKSFPGVQTRVSPARIAFLEDEIEVNEINRSISGASLLWQIAPPMAQSPNRFAAPGLPVYRGFDVFEFRESEDSSKNRTITRKMNTLDYRIGRIWREAKDNAPRNRFPVKMHLIGRLEIAKFLQFFDSKKGRVVPFWYNPQTMDFKLLEITPPNANSLKVKRTGQAAFRAAGKNRRDLVIRLRNGATHYRRITSAIEASGEETLNLDQTILDSIAPADVQFISLLRPVRFDADKLGLQWITNDKVYLQFNLFDLIDL